MARLASPSHIGERTSETGGGVRSPRGRWMNSNPPKHASNLHAEPVSNLNNLTAAARWRHELTQIYNNNKKKKKKTETSWDSPLGESRQRCGPQGCVSAYILLCGREEECVFTQTSCVNMRRYSVNHLLTSCTCSLRRKARCGGERRGCRCLNVLNNAEIAHYYVYARGIIHFLLHRTLVSPLAALRDR